MQKKLVCVLIIIIFAVFIAIPALAHPLDEHVGNIPEEGVVGDATYMEENEEGAISEVDPLEELLQEIIKSKNIGETKRFLITFTQPSNNDTVSGSLNFICGYINRVSMENSNIAVENTQTEDVITVILTRYNAETGTYEEYKSTEGESRWNIGESGVFTKVTELLKGVNKLKIIIFRRPVKSLKIDVNPSIAAEAKDWLEAGLKTEADTKNLSATGSKVGGQTEVLTETSSQAQSKVEAENKIEVEDIVLEAGKNLQISYFTINVLNETAKDELINKPVKISNMFKNIFPN